METELSSELQGAFDGPDSFDAVMRLQGRVLRQLGGRETLRFEVAGRGYYAKIHRGIGWKEILKNLLTLRLPVLGARNERTAIHRVRALNVPTLRVVGFGERGWNPARRESFLITAELPDMISLEHFCAGWRTNPPAPSVKWALVRRVAEIARLLHGNGLNHRDFYLCHFLLPRPSQPNPSASDVAGLHLIDLHRMQSRRRTPVRWVIKDLAGLFFSSMDAGLTRRDLFRFVQAYEQLPLARILNERAWFWTKVRRRAVRLYRRVHGLEPMLPPASRRES